VLPRPGFEGLFEPAAGMIWSERALALFRAEAERAGASFFEREGAAHLEALPEGGVRVRTSAGRIIHGRRAVLAGGAWTQELLAYFGLRLDLELWPMLWGHYHVDAALAASYPQWFCFQRADATSGDGGLYYGFAVHDDVPRIKVGIDWCPEHLRVRDTASFQREPDLRLIALLDRFLRTHWRGIGDPIEFRVSPYTMTRDNRFVLDRLPTHPSVTLFTGGSGHAFKFAPLIGLALAELVLGKEPSFDLAPLAVDRPLAGLQRLSPT
jgi:sarcosine oxidase